MASQSLSPKKCALIIASDEKLRGQAGQILSSVEIAVYLACHGAAALKVLSERAFDLILADTDLPDLNGMGLLDKIREMHPFTPVTLISSGLAQPDLVRALRHGACDLIEKPLQTKDLLDSIERFFARDTSATRSRLEALSLNQRHIIIVEMILKGMGNKEIASAMKISEQGIKYHIGRLLKRFDARNRNDLRSKIHDLIKMA